MPRVLSFKEIFDELTAGEIVTIPFPTKKNFECMRVSLSRRFSQLRKDMSAIGDDPYEGKRIKSSCKELEPGSPEQQEYIYPFLGTFQLVDANDKFKLYTVADLN